MGTKVDCKSYLPGYYYSMRDLNEDSSSSSWPICYGDKAMTYGYYYNGFMPMNMIDGYSGYCKDALKQKMLEHEAVFRNQVYELHRLYRIQRDMMEEFKRNELHRLRASLEPSSSSSLRVSQMPSQDARKWHMAGFPLLNSGYERTSVSGVEIENSFMSCTKGYNNRQPCHFPFQNGSSLKESEPPDSRPLKVRKKLFDLQLPANDNIDTEESEELPENKVHSGSMRLADLNEPVEIEETMAPSTIDFLDHSSINGGKKGENCQPAKSNAGYLGVNEKTVHIRRDGCSVKSSVENRVHERGWFSHLHEAGFSKSNLSSLTHSLPKGKMPITFHPVPGTLIQAPASDPFFSSPCFATSRPHSIPSWTNPTSNFTPKSTPVESRPDSSGNVYSSAQIGEKWLVNASPTLNPGLGGEITAKNGFYHGFTSKSKETNVHLPSAGGFDYLNCSRADNLISDCSTNHLFGNSKPAIDIDLNEAEDGKSKTTLLWLKRKPAHASEPPITDLNQPSGDYEIVMTKKETAETRNVKKILGFPISETGPSENMPSSSASTGFPNNIGKEKKNRIIDINLECEPDEEIVAVELPVEKAKMSTKGAFAGDYIDLNSCVSDSIEEDALAPSYESKAASVKIAFKIDLEAPVENEDDMVVEASLQLLQNKNETLQDEILKRAAEIIVTISSSRSKIHSDNNFHPSDASLSESLMWFVNQLEHNESTVRDAPDGPPCKEMDDFEAMTLQIQETKVEDYMPAPFVPEFQNSEETGPANNTNNMLATRSRRGQSRRGRQRKDFQRDILPGLASLSRHEVTEDIQTFGGLMRATGHHWVSGLTRRKGGGRGRRRAVVERVSAISSLNNQACTPLVGQINKNIEGGLEDRSLTGWGKTTRRPRRQRCPTGNNINNPPAVVLT